MIKPIEKPKYTESSVKVFFTNDYSIFHFMHGNRDLNEKKINRIINEVQSGNNMLKYVPIVVDKDFKILDGQHRFMVSKKTGNPVFFVIRDKMDIKQVAKLNSNTSNWKMVDYLNSFASIGIESYLELEQLQKQWPVSLNVMAAMLHLNVPVGSKVKEKFINGELEINYFGETIATIKLAKTFIPFIDNPFSSRFLTVCQRLRSLDDYDHELMIKKLKASGLRIDRLASPKTILLQMEEIINFRNSKTRIRLM